MCLFVGFFLKIFSFFWFQIPAHLDLLTMHVKGDDFHSTSSAETNTGDSGHGSDEDLAVYTLNNYPIAISPTQIRPGGIFSITRTTPPSLGPPSRSCQPISFTQRGQSRDARKQPQPSPCQRSSQNLAFDGPIKRHVSNSSIKDEESDLNTTTSGSYSVTPDDFWNIDFDYHCDIYDVNDLVV